MSIGIASIEIMTALISAIRTLWMDRKQFMCLALGNQLSDIVRTRVEISSTSTLAMQAKTKQVPSTTYMTVKSVSNRLLESCIGRYSPYITSHRKLQFSLVFSFFF